MAWQSCDVLTTRWFAHPGRATEAIFPTRNYKGVRKADHGLSWQPYRRVRRIHTQGMVQGSRAIWCLNWDSRGSRAP